MHVEDFSNFKFDSFSELREQKENDTIKVQDLVESNSNLVTLYHGTKTEDFEPDWKHNNPRNDFGRGLYTTPDLQLALEWSMAPYTEGENGYAYEYLFDTTGLNILKLDVKDTMRWVAILLENRPVRVSRSKSKRTLNYTKPFLDAFGVDISQYDAIVGYRADDSYFAYLKDFITGTMRIKQLQDALVLGELGYQWCIKSEKAFNRLKLVKRHKATDKHKEDYIIRDQSARDAFKEMPELTNEELLNEDPDNPGVATIIKEAAKWRNC